MDRQGHGERKNGDKTSERKRDSNDKHTDRGIKRLINILAERQEDYQLKLKRRTIYM